MKFDEKQVEALSAPLSRDCIKNRELGGRKVFYIEGWKAIAEANRIFGFDGWSRETVELSETNRTLVDLTSSRGPYQQWRVGYIARVRITVGTIVREGSGYGSGMAKPEALGDAVEGAIKEAETDAMKRALMTFGNPFGLALYDKEQAEVEDAPKPPPAPPPSPPAPAPLSPEQWAQKAITIILGANAEELHAFTEKHHARISKYRLSLPALHAEIVKAIQVRNVELAG